MKNELWVICGEVDDLSIGLIDKGNQLAKEQKLELIVCVVSTCLADTALDRLKAFHVKELINIAADASDVNLKYSIRECLFELIKSNEPMAIICENVSLLSELAATLAIDLDCGITVDCTQLKWDSQFGLVQIRPAFGGCLTAENISDRIPYLATVRRGIFTPQSCCKSTESNSITLKTYTVSAETPFAETVKVYSSGGKCPTDADIIFAGGIGMESAKNFQLLYKLAEITGAAVGASRAAVSEGYAPSCLQIGLTGVSVRPRLYLAFGISGAVQHICAITNSNKIIAINTDANAAIRKYCDLFINENCVQFAESLLKELEKKRSNRISSSISDMFSV